MELIIPIQTPDMTDYNGFAEGAASLERLAGAIERQDGESGGHMSRIYGITSLILRGTALGDGLSDRKISDIALASMFHDVGKITVPHNILSKPGKLTGEEYGIMKTHTVNGAKLLESIPEFRSHRIYSYAHDIARHHHERWDGGGYPDGLRGDGITLWAQTVSLADAYDALCSRRAYKEAYDCGVAAEMIRSGQCGAFSPRLLKCFFSVEGELRRMYGH